MKYKSFAIKLSIICRHKGPQIYNQFIYLNAHKFHHNFECLRPIYNCRAANEDNEHYLLHCPRFNQLQEDLFGTVTEVLGIDIANLPGFRNLVQLASL